MSDVHAVDPVAIVGAHEADIANDAVVAQLDVPINVPVNEPLNDPVLICTELLTNPSGIPVRLVHVVDPVACVGAHDADNAETAKDEVVANELDIALLAQLAVPIKVPMIWLVTFNEPVIP